MHPSIVDKTNDMAAACRRLGVVRLAVFGSAARGVDFDVEHSDADLLVTFGHWDGHDPYPNLKAEMETT